MKNNRPKGFKMDANTISQEPWELEYVVDKFAKEGYYLTKGQVLDMVINYKGKANQRNNIYNEIRRIGNL